jgi:CheY-like chemotaxis protein
MVCKSLLISKMSKKVLIVEDEFLVSFLMEHYFSAAREWEVLASVDNGKEAIEIAQSAKPDLILMDIRIDGDMDGIETVKKIQQTYNIPVIYTSGNTDQQTAERAGLTNPLGFLVKPVNKEDLLDLLALVNKKGEAPDSSPDL